jgi:hypothetical protein
MKEKHILNFVVSAYPAAPFLGTRTEEEELLACKELAVQIKRHCNIEQVAVNYETIYKCSYCGYEWEEPPGCCDKAMDEYEKEHPGCYPL